MQVQVVDQTTHRNAIVSLDWTGKSAPVPLLWLWQKFFEVPGNKYNNRKARKFYIYTDVSHTHTQSFAVHLTRYHPPYMSYILSQDKKVFPNRTLKASHVSGLQVDSK